MDQEVGAAAASEGRLRSLAEFLRSMKREARHVGYSEAETLAHSLAVRLRDEVGEADLASAELRAIPRGGFFILGMLAYGLGASREQFRPRQEGLLVLVDDCILSGLRLRQQLAAVDEGRPVVVAHLLSTPGLRDVLRSTEPRVRCCVGADDLVDLSPRLYPRAEEHAAWLRRSESRLGKDQRYWIGLPQPVSFAWGEPDRPFWNDVTERVEDGWRFLPPHRCLKNASRLARDLPSVGGTGGHGGWRCPETLIWGDFEDRLWLVRESDEEVFSLTGPAALAWKALAVGWDEEEAAAAMSAAFQVSVHEALRDVTALREELVAHRLLEPVET